MMRFISSIFQVDDLNDIIFRLCTTVYSATNIGAEDSATSTGIVRVVAATSASIAGVATSTSTGSAAVTY